MSLLTGGLVVLMAMLLSGCTTSPVLVGKPVPYLDEKPPQLRPIYRRVLSEGQRNTVLNHLRAALAAMDIGEYDLSKSSLDTALDGIEAVYANNDTARKARSLWHNEGMKDFKGEPYERAMAYYYRGLLYLREADFENARACFRCGTDQDAFAEEQQNRCDFALLIFLDGWASQCLGDRDLAAEAYEDAKKLRPDFVLPDLNHNVLILAETGTSPLKVSAGSGQSELHFLRGTGFDEQRARIVLGEGVYDAYPMEDIAWQAMTRGGRAVDKILEGKVHFRETHEQIGKSLTEMSATALLAAPLFEKSKKKVQIAGAVTGVIGIGELVMASRVRTEADARYWDNLPDTVHVFTCELPSEEPTVTVSFLDLSHNELPDLKAETKVEFPDGEHGIAWVKSRSACSTFQ